LQSVTLPPGQPFNLHLTLGCGQVFRWTRDGEWWTGIVEGKVIRIRQDARTLIFTGADHSFINHYFHLDADLPAILAHIDRDEIIGSAIRRCEGLRIIRQPAWECLASYICATYANIPGIKKRIFLLSKRFGDSLVPGEEKYYSFPTPETLARSAPCDVKSCSLGYRAPYLCETAVQIARDPGWEETMRSLSYTDARKELLKLKGVGKKVADCVLLFAFQNYDAFPVDVWIERIMKYCYQGEENLKNYDQIAGSGRRMFGQYAGYAQEYLFCDRNEIIPWS